MHYPFTACVYLDLCILDQLNFKVHLKSHNNARIGNNRGMLWKMRIGSFLNDRDPNKDWWQSALSIKSALHSFGRRETLVHTVCRRVICNSRKFYVNFQMIRNEVAKSELRLKIMETPYSCFIPVGNRQRRISVAPEFVRDSFGNSHRIFYYCKTIK